MTGGLRRIIEELLLGYDHVTYSDDQENGTKAIDYNKVKKLIDESDEGLLSLLFSNHDIKEKLFKQIKDIYVFKAKDFKFFLDENKINNSYTQFANRIGLADGYDHIIDRGDVVLNFPFKDCVLEGGQTKDDQKRNEIFYNEIIAKDEIDRLLDPKALVNWKRITAKGEEKATAIKRHPDGTIADNLLIKGNNLIALHSLKEQFAGKVKLIYIDPPYNTNSNANTFAYNNLFNHSTWLTFMKNRLEMARDLLRDDGFITMTIDHFELFYLGEIADEIFGRENRLGVITIVIKPEGRQFSKFFSHSTEFMIVYAKNKENAVFQDVILSEVTQEKFNKKDAKGKYRTTTYLNYNPVEISGRNINPDNWYPFYVNRKTKKISLIKKEGYDELHPVENGIEKSWQTNKETAQLRIDDNDLEAEIDEDAIQIMLKIREGQRYVTHWFDKKYNASAYGTKYLNKICPNNNFSYPKSIYAVFDTLKIMTSGQDIVLDFFAGSGTTAHAVMELNKEDDGNRQFILCEQMDYIETVTKKRIEAVIKQNGGDFIYLELAQWNEQAKQDMLAAKDLPALKKLFANCYETYFLNYNVEIAKFNQEIITAEFEQKPLAEQKRCFVEMLDMNQMYVHATEMTDKKFAIAPADQKLTNEFYGD